MHSFFAMVPKMQFKGPIWKKVDVWFYSPLAKYWCFGMAGPVDCNPKGSVFDELWLELGQREMLTI